MNNKFNKERFLKYFKMDLQNIWPKFGITMLILTLLPIAAWLFFSVLSIDRDFDSSIIPFVRNFEIVIFAMFASIMAPSRMYKTCNLPQEGIYYAMLPASRHEKFLSQFLICTLVCPIACLLGGVVVDIFFTALPFGPYNEWLWYYGGDVDFNMTDFIDVATGYQFCMFCLMLILSYFSQAAVFMFTNTIFKTHKVIKTVLAIWAISFALQLLVLPILALGGMDWFVSATPSYFSWYFTISVITDAAFAVLFFWLTYRRLKKMTY